MRAAPIDLNQIRQRRDEAIRLGRLMAERYNESLGHSVRRWAERTDAAMAPIADADAEAARALARWGARRLRAEVKRTLVNIEAGAVADTAAVAEQAFDLLLTGLGERRIIAKTEGGQ